MASAFARARSYWQPVRGWTIAAPTFGVIASVLYLAWLFLFVLFVQLLLHEGDKRLQGAEASYARVLLKQPETGRDLELIDAGLLPSAVAVKDRWYGPLYAWLYRTQPWMHRNVSLLMGLLVATVLVGFARVLLLYMERAWAARATAFVRLRLQREIFNKKFELGSRAFDPEAGSSIEDLLNVSIPAVEAGLFSWLDVMPRESVKMALLLGFVLALNPWLGLSFLLMAGLLWLVGYPAVMRILRRRKRLADQANAELLRLLGLSDTLRLIKGFAADRFFRDSIDRRLQTYDEVTTRRSEYEARLHPYFQFSGLILILLVMGLAAQNVLSEKFALSAATGVGIALLSLILPTQRLLTFRQSWRGADRHAETIFEYLDRPALEAQREGEAFLAPLMATIEFDHVSYRDSRGKVLLSDVSARIHAGQRVAVVGRSDVEKRAFLYLLVRFIDPSMGRVTIDGVDIRDVTIESLRSQIALVLKSDMLFPDTVANNISLGEPGFTLTRVIEAAKTAHAHHFIHRLPHGYECVVGPEGFPLKVGESYRLALARAILRDPSVVIVEEPTVALDDDTKAALDDTMARFFPRRTVILLPHRLSTLRTCDQIFLLDQGKLITTGSHRELLEQSELYRHLTYTEFRQPSFVS